MMTDETLIIAAVLDGEANALEPLVAKYEKPIFNLMHRVTKSFDEASELTQEAFLKAYEKLHQFQMDRNFFSWLYALAQNTGRDYLRCKTPTPTLFGYDPVASRIFRTFECGGDMV